MRKLPPSFFNSKQPSRACRRTATTRSRPDELCAAGSPSRVYVNGDLGPCENPAPRQLIDLDPVDDGGHAPNAPNFRGGHRARLARNAALRLPGGGVRQFLPPDLLPA